MTEKAPDAFVRLGQLLDVALEVAPDERRIVLSQEFGADDALIDTVCAILSELEFPWQICRGIAVISRCVGLVGHLAEEMKNPLGREIWQRLEEEVFENRDQ